MQYRKKPKHQRLALVNFLRCISCSSTGSYFLNPCALYRVNNLSVDESKNPIYLGEIRPGMLCSRGGDLTAPAAAVTLVRVECVT